MGVHASYTTLWHTQVKITLCLLILPFSSLFDSYLIATHSKEKNGILENEKLQIPGSMSP